MRLRSKFMNFWVHCQTSKLSEQFINLLFNKGNHTDLRRAGLKVPEYEVWSNLEYYVSPDYATKLIL